MFKKYRVQKGYTQEQLAELLDISPRHLQRIENVEIIPTLDMFRKLVKILNISDKDILEYIKKG